MLEENAANEIKIKSAEAASIAKSQILANTSHELRTPLGAIIGILSSFEVANLTTDQKDMIDILACTSDMVLSIVNDILYVARLEAKKIILMNTTFDLLELFESTIESFGKKAGTKRIELIVNCEVDMLPRYIKSDPESIDPEYIKYAWQSYSQSDMSMTKMQDGTGLGLSICKSLVEINGGEINVESQLGIGNTRNALLNYFKAIKKIDAFETFDEGINAAKSYRKLNNQSAYDVAFIGLYKDNEQEVMKAALELRGLEMNNNNLIIIFIVFSNNEENELAKKLIRKVGGIATVLHTPITWKKLINLFMQMEKSYSDIDIDNKKLDINENIFKSVVNYEGITKFNSKMNKCILCVDDNAISLENTLQQVSKLGYSTISAANGLEAVKLIYSKSKLLNDAYSSSSFFSH
ncbi:hybrid sensor histidine kinase/response regulator [Gigaspora margarita]|uniref:histidine kinase n=1 Tax=Gigaspora margarita TaxID=4874 RepID=A0A8H3X805_GIGMA|nr:hybrid sensor histidine kinase/response regulator [Gigaspora margarita]